MRRMFWLAAGLLAAVFFTLHAMGARDAVSLLSGTPTADPVMGVGGGFLYALSWFGLSLVAPVLLIAGLLVGLLLGRARPPRGFGGRDAEGAATR
ncbi:MAG: hypothetical protein AB8I08_12770 [Sandaracinaceae bacterium]